MPTVKELQTLWTLARIKIVLFSVATMWTCWSTATSGVDMTQLHAWEWFQTIGGCMAAWCLTMMAFVDKSASQVASGHLPGLDVNVEGESTTTTTTNVKETTTPTGT